MSRWRKRGRSLDANHLEIVRALERVGCTVLDLSAVGGGAPDLAVGRGRITYLLELKSGRRALKGDGWADEAHQRERMAAWRGGDWVKVASVDEALRAVGAVA